MANVQKSGLRVELIDSLARLQDVEAAYDALLAEQPGRRVPLLDRSWINGFHRAYLRRGQSLFFLALMRGNRMVALFPLVLCAVGRPVTLLRKLQFFGQDAAALALVNFCADLVISAGEDPHECMRLFRSTLHNELAARWDLMELRLFCGTSTFRAAFEEIFGCSGVKGSLTGYAIDLPKQVVGLQGCFSKSTDRLLKRKTKRLTESGLPFSFHVDSHIDRQVFDEIAAVHTARQSMLEDRGKEGRDSIFEHARWKEALFEVLQALSASGRLRLHGLRIDGTLAAFQLVFFNGQEVCAWLTAFDPRFEKLSPSRLLMHRMYEVEIERYATTVIDQMPGFTPIKKELSNREYVNWSYARVNGTRALSRLRYAGLLVARRLRAALPAGRSAK